MFVVSGPWYGVLDHPQWDRVTWVPFTGEEDQPRDIVANVLLMAHIEELEQLLAQLPR